MKNGATLPLTAHHFGTITPWGVLANVAGIPLTGIWIMPAGLFVLATQFLLVPGWMAGAALWVMQAGIDWLVAVAGLFTDLPAAPFRVPPPDAAVLVLPLRLKTACWVGAAGIVIGGIALPTRDRGHITARPVGRMPRAGGYGACACRGGLPLPIRRAICQSCRSATGRLPADHRRAGCHGACDRRSVFAN